MEKNRYQRDFLILHVTCLSFVSWACVLLVITKGKEPCAVDSALLSRTMILLINRNLWLFYLCCWFNLKVLNNNQHLQCELRTVYEHGQPDHVNYQLTQWRHSIGNDSEEKSQYRTRYRIDLKNQHRPILTQSLSDHMLLTGDACTRPSTADNMFTSSLPGKC